MNIIVLASATRSSGALTIYKQFLSHLPNYVKDNKYYIFVDPSMPQPEIENVEYIHDSNHSYKHRMYMDKEGYMKIMKGRGILPDVVFSLQNTGCVTNCRQVVYYHQSLPFYPQRWNPFKKHERTMFLYKYIYPIFVKRTLNKHTEIIVQIQFIKNGFVKRFNYNPDKVHVAFPDVEKINIDSVVPYDFNNECYNFIYPASPSPYKNHLTIAKALNELKTIDGNLVDKIRVHLTTGEKDSSALYDYIKENKLTHCFEFHGIISHEKLLSMYKSSIGLLFPSVIETLGLPLLEAAAFALPIIAADLDYAREVTTGYDGVKFVAPYQYQDWADSIRGVCNSKQIYEPLVYRFSEWDKILRLILFKEMDCNTVSISELGG